MIPVAPSAPRRILRSADPIRAEASDQGRCPLCGFLWEDHPKIVGTDEPYCRSFFLEAVRA